MSIKIQGKRLRDSGLSIGSKFRLEDDAPGSWRTIVNEDQLDIVPLFPIEIEVKSED